jgi:hypothetical protein
VLEIDHSSAPAAELELIERVPSFAPLSLAAKNASLPPSTRSPSPPANKSSVDLENPDVPGCVIGYPTPG